jgi:hypothetical protein
MKFSADGHGSQHEGGAACPWPGITRIDAGFPKKSLISVPPATRTIAALHKDASLARGRSSFAHETPAYAALRPMTLAKHWPHHPGEKGAVTHDRRFK